MPLRNYAWFDRRFLGWNIAWGLRLWQAERAPVREISWYWQEFSALKIAIFAHANIEFLEESFQNNYHTYTDERYLNSDLFLCNHKFWMSRWAEILISYVGKNWGDNSIQILKLAETLGEIWSYTDPTRALSGHSRLFWCTKSMPNKSYNLRFRWFWLQKL